MARYDHLPIWKDAVALTALLEEVVPRFPRYHKYALGADLRRQAYAVCRGVVVANGERDGRLAAVERLVLECGYLKTGFKRRVFHSLWWPTPQAVTSPSSRPVER